MIRWLVKQYRFRARVRQYRRQIERLEAELAILKREFEAETWRNRSREDMFVSAAVMGARGMWGVAPRSASAYQPKPDKPQAPAYDPYQFYGPDLMEFNTFWLPDAV